MPVSTFNLRVRSLFPRSNVHKREPGRRLTEARQERLELFHAAHIIGDESLLQPFLIEVYRKPEGEPAPRLEVRRLKVFVDAIRQGSPGIPSTVEARNE